MKHEDDIDLFFIVASGSLWVSRLLATILMNFLGRRHPGDRQVTNKVCLNMFMTEDAVAVVSSERDCFSAHEVLQMEPLWERGGIYRKFLRANQWVKRFLPNAWEEKYQASSIKYKGRRGYIIFSLLRNTSFLILRLFEPLARFIQLQYMKHRRTNEIISDTVLRFHPRDARVWVKRKLAKRLARYNIPLDNIFYGG